MAKPLMAKATAVWLVDNTTISFKQIADFVEMHELEVQGIADGDVATGVKGFDPIANNQLVQEEIDAAVETVRQGGRGLYGLVNNAGVFIGGPLIEVSVDDYEWINGFIHDYKQALDPQWQDSIYTFNKAKYHFHIKEYGEVVFLLVQAADDSVVVV